MMRFLVTMLLVLSAELLFSAEPLKFDEPLNLLKEFRKIDDQFRKVKGPKDPAYAQAVATRDDALRQLIAKAEAENSVQYPVMSNIYMTLGRYDDAIRMFDLIVEAEEDDPLFYYRGRLVEAYIAANQLDDAIATFRTIVTMELDLEYSSDYIRETPQRMKLIIGAMKSAGRIEEAAELLTLSSKQWKAIKDQIVELPEKDQNRYPDTYLLATIDELSKDLKVALATPPAKLPDPKPGDVPLEVAKNPEKMPAKIPAALAFDIRPLIGKIALKYPFNPMTVGRDTNPEYQAQVKARQLAYSKLADQAVAGKSTDHASLMLVYGLADRKGDTLRELQLFQADNPGSFNSHWLIFKSLGNLSDPEPALEFVNKWIDTDVKLSNFLDFSTPLTSHSDGIVGLCYQMGNLKKLDEAEAALTKLLSKVKQLRKEFNATADKTKGLREADFINSLSTINQCFDTLDKWRVFHFGPPLNVAEAYQAILTKFRTAAKVAMDPAYAQALAERNESLAQLLAKAKTQRPLDLGVMGLICLELQQYDEGFRYLNLVGQEQPDSAFWRSKLINAYLNAERQEEALAAMREMLRRKVPLKTTDDYRRGVEVTLPRITKLLIEQGRTAEAAELVAQSETQLKTILAEIALLPPEERKSIPIVNLNVAIQQVRSTLDQASKTPGSVAKPAGAVAELRDATVKVYVAHQIIPKTPGRDLDPVYQAKLKARFDAFNQLVDQAEAAKSTDHELLMAIYAEADRRAEALREAKSVLAANPNTFVKHGKVMQALAQCVDPDLAVDFLNRWIDADVPVAKFRDYIHPLEKDKGVLAVINRLGDLGREAEAYVLIDRIESKIDSLQKQFNDAPMKPAGLTASDFQSTKYSMGECKSNLSSWNDFYINTPSFPPTSKSAEVAKPVPTEKVPAVSGKVDIRKSLAELKRVHTFDRKVLGREHNPEYQAKLKARQDAFRALAAQAEEAKSTDYLAMAYCYAAADQQSEAYRARDLSRGGKPVTLAHIGEEIVAISQLRLGVPSYNVFAGWVYADLKPADYATFVNTINDPEHGLLVMVDRFGDLDIAPNLQEYLTGLQKRLRDLKIRFQVTTPAPAGIKEEDFSKAQQTVEAAIKVATSWQEFHTQNKVELAKWKEANPGPGTEMDLAFEIRKLDRLQYVDRRTLGRETNAPLQARLEARKKAFEELIERATSNGSKDHPRLVYVYGEADRQVDALREADLALADAPDSFEQYPQIMQGLARLSDPKPAVTFLNRWLNAEVTWNNAAEYLKSLDSANTGVRAVLDRLGDLKRDEEAQTLLKQVQTKVDNLSDQFAAATEKPAGLRAADFRNAQLSVSLTAPNLERWREFHAQVPPPPVAMPAPTEVAKVPVTRDPKKTGSNTGPPKISAVPMKTPEQLKAEVAKQAAEVHLSFVKAEASIYGKFRIRPMTPGRDTSAEYQTAVQDRRKAFADLLKGALEAKIEDRALLMRLYAGADRKEETVREGELILAEAPGKHDKHTEVLTAYARLDDMEPLLNLMNKWVDTEVSLESYSNYMLPFTENFSGFSVGLRRLFDKNRLEEATSLLDRLEAKLKVMHQKFLDASKKPDGLREVDFTNPLVGIKSDRALMEDWREFHLVNNISSGPLTFSEPLDVAREFDRIKKRRSIQSQGMTQGEIFDQAQTNFTQGLTQLLMAAEGAKSKDHYTFVKIYAALGQHEAMQREAELWLAENPASFAALAEWSSILLEAKRPDDAWQVRRKALSLDLPANAAAEFAKSSPMIVGQWCDDLLDDGKATEAATLMKLWEGQLTSLKEKATNAPVVLKSNLTAIDGTFQVVKKIKELVDRAVVREALVGKPYIPITAERLLNGEGFDPAGKVLLLEFCMLQPGQSDLAIKKLKDWQAEFGTDKLAITGVMIRTKAKVELSMGDPPQAIVTIPAQAVAAAMTTQQSDEELIKYTKILELKFPFAVQGNAELFGKYGIWTVPTAVVVDRKGIVRYVVQGWDGKIEARLHAELEKVLEAEK